MILRRFSLLRLIIVKLTAVAVIVNPQSIAELLSYPNITALIQPAINGKIAPIIAIPIPLLRPCAKCSISSSNPKANIMKTMPHSPICSSISLCSGKKPKLLAKAPKIISHKTSTVDVFLDIIFETTTIPRIMADKSHIF